MTRENPVLLPQRTVVTVGKVRRLAQYLRARRQGPSEAISWRLLPQADRDWWFHEALRHLVVADLVLERDREASLSQDWDDGAVPAACQT